MAEQRPASRNPGAAYCHARRGFDTRSSIVSPARNPRRCSSSSDTSARTSCRGPAIRVRETWIVPVIPTCRREPLRSIVHDVKRGSRMHGEATSGRCPYCVLVPEFQEMKLLTNGRMICERCGHIEFPEGQAFFCPCMKCVEISLSRRLHNFGET
jgi:hypothetical protein